MQPRRNHHRSAAHAEAHSEDGSGTLAEIPMRAGIPHGRPSVVTTQPQLLQLVEQLREAGSFAYDSEFIGEMSYIPHLCLIQVATRQLVTLIDPISGDGLDLTPFWELICDERVEKIVHAGEQDIEPVYRHLPDRVVANIFDTQIASGFAAITYPVSLSKLVLEMIGVKLAKGFTFTNWDHRPLSSSQLRYAADDVRYLPVIRDELVRRLEALGHLADARLACAALTDPALYAPDPEGNFMRIRGASGLEPAKLAVLRALAIWRDASARRENIPARTLLRDEVLLAMARSPVRSVEKLANIKGLPRPVESQYGRDLVEVTQGALALPREQMPVARSNDETAVEKFSADALYACIEAHCFTRSIDPALVTSRQEIGELHRRWIAGQETDDLRLMKGWRRHVAGEAALRLLAGEAVGTIRWSAPVPTKKES